MKYGVTGITCWGGGRPSLGRSDQAWWPPIKNVTGYDVTRLSRSEGTLVVRTKMIVKLIAKPERVLPRHRFHRGRQHNEFPHHGCGNRAACLELMDQCYILNREDLSPGFAHQRRCDADHRGGWVRRDGGPASVGCETFLARPGCPPLTLARTNRSNRLCMVRKLGSVAARSARPWSGRMRRCDQQDPEMVRREKRSRKI